MVGSGYVTKQLERWAAPRQLRHGLVIIGATGFPGRPPIAGPGSPPVTWGSWGAYGSAVADSQVRAVTKLLRRAIKGQ